MKKITRELDDKELKAETIIFNTDKSDALKGIVEETAVSNIFFSPENVKAIQESIRYYIYKLSGMAISNQSQDQLHILLRSLILQYGNIDTQKPVAEVKRLNQKVVDKCTQNILVEIKQYTGYIEDLQKLPGVGRKTANVVGSVYFDIPAMPVDTHVFRVSDRIGLTFKQVPDENLYSGLTELQELPELDT